MAGTGRSRGGRAIGVVDVGSNSGRLTVVAAAGGHLEILADARSPLRLVRDVDRDGRLGAAAQERIIAALRDFSAVATTSGASSVAAVATAAVREAANRAEVVARITAETGIEVEVLEGDAEARYAMAGAVHGLPVDSGLLVDIGGGSVEVCQFRHRRPVQQWTLPLGALRMTDRFLGSDPPKGGELRALAEHVRDVAVEAGLRPLREGERLVGSGGTIRNLAKCDRAPRTYPIPRLHGYELRASDVERLTTLLAQRPVARRQAVPGLSDDRAGSITGGAVCAGVLLDILGAASILVAGRGLREGVALERLRLPMLSAAEVRQASVRRLASRFSTFDEPRADQRVSLALNLADAVAPQTPAPVLELLEHAAVLVDIGRSIDYYDRWEHAAQTVANADLYGFSHHDIVILSALLERAGVERVTLPGFRAVVSAPERRLVEKMASILALADHVCHRSSATGGAITVKRRIATWDLGGTAISLDSDLASRFQRSCGVALRI